MKHFPLTTNIIFNRQLFSLSSGSKSCVNLSGVAGPFWSDAKHFVGEAYKSTLPKDGFVGWVAVTLGHNGKTKNVLIANKNGKLFEAEMPILWCAYGEAEAVEFGQDDSALADYLHEYWMITSGNMAWVKTPRNPQKVAQKLGLHLVPICGFTDTNSDVFVSVYWGNSEGEIFQPLSKSDQAGLKQQLVQLEKRAAKKSR